MIEPTHFALGMTIGAIGNRCSGSYSHLAGALIMAFGTVICWPELVLWYPLIALLIGIFRAKGTGKTWLAYEAGTNRMGALLRGALIFLPAVAYTVIDHNPVHMWLAFGFPVIAAFYRICGRVNPDNATEAAELLTGSYAAAV